VKWNDVGAVFSVASCICLQSVDLADSLRRLDWNESKSLMKSFFYNVWEWNTVRIRKCKNRKHNINYNCNYPMHPLIVAILLMKTMTSTSTTTTCSTLLGGRSTVCNRVTGFKNFEKFGCFRNALAMTKRTLPVYEVGPLFKFFTLQYCTIKFSIVRLFCLFCIFCADFMSTLQ